MNKAKAAFTAAIILVVSGATAVCWYLNENGIIGETDDVSAQYVDTVEDANVYDGNDYYLNEDDGEEPDAEQSVQTTVMDSDEPEDIEKDNQNTDNTGINEFLSIFSKLYFCANDSYSKNAPDSYELLKFAYLYETVFNGGAKTDLKYTDDDVGAYNGIEADAAQEIIDRFFGVQISRESVYTENTYAFFKYEDGYFYTPAADGIGHENLTVSDSVVRNGDNISVEFTVYSQGVSCDMTAEQARTNGTEYASGRAEIRIVENDFQLIYYSVTE